MAAVLLAEDNRREADLVRLFLERDGHTVTVAQDGEQALEQARSSPPDVMLLDVMMPKVGGFDVARVLQRECPQTPIVFMTARADECDVLTGFEAGGDDYLTKPFSFKEMVVRVRAVLRRGARREQRAPVIRIGELEIDFDARSVRSHGHDVDTTSTEFGVLQALAEHPKTVLSRRQLIDAALGWDADCLERTIDMHISNLRHKIEPEPSTPRYLLTSKGHGYRLAAADEVALA